MCKAIQTEKKKHVNAIHLANQMKAGVPGCKPEDLFVVHSVNGEIFFINLTWRKKSLDDQNLRTLTTGL